MPLLRKKALERPNDMLELLKDDDEVFYCEITNELFRDYEEYCERVILINSMVWSCSMTGKSNLTYAEALKSEQEATRELKKFPAELRVPILYLASRTKRKSLKDMLEDVFLYAKDNFFIGETVQIQYNNEWTEGKVVKVQEAPKNGTQTEKATYIYDVKLLPITSDSNVVSVKSGEIQRKRAVYNRPKNKLFLKQHVEQADGIFRIKESALKKYNINEIKFSNIFVGDAPNFATVSKTKTSDLNSSGKNQKQETLAKYFSKVDGSPISAKVVNGDGKGLKDKPFAVKKSIEQQLKDKKNLKEKKPGDKMSFKDLEARMHKFLRQWHVSKDDLELTDQHVMPPPTPVEAFFTNQTFGDFVTVLEFLHTFQTELNIKESFPHGVSWDILERALTLKEINGPLHDIFHLLLTYIFDTLSAEYSANKKSRQPVPVLVSSSEENTLPWYVERATAAWRFANTQFGTILGKKQLDAITLSEILRLHLLASGGKVRENLTKYRCNQRGGYDSTDDPGLQLRISCPHILKALAMYNLCQLPRHDLLKLLICLMNQILTYTPIRDILEKRLEAAAKAKYELKTLEILHRKTINEYNTNKQKCVKDVETDPSRDNTRALDLLEKDHKTYLQNYTIQCDELLRIQFQNEILLGSDRCHRRYWLFGSVPGLFVEDHEENAGSCLSNIVQQHPILSTCDPADYLTNLKKIFKEHHIKTHDKENNDVSIISKIVNNNTVVDKSALYSKALELNMCTADNSACKVHGNVDKVRWSFFYKRDEVDALISSLNKRGARERYLLNNLKQWKELIYDRIDNCPLEKLSKELKAGITLRPKMKYNENDTMLNYPIGTEPSVILKNSLVEFIIDLQERISNGALGKLQVDDVKLWSETLIRGDYDMQCEEITWGQQDGRMFLKKKSGEILTVVATGKDDVKSVNGDDDDDEEDEDDDEDDDEDEDDEEYTLVEAAKEGYYDPGHCLGAALDIDSEDSEEEIFVLHESTEQKECLHNICCALLQVAQSVTKTNLVLPLGPYSGKNKEPSSTSHRRAKRMFRRWEISLMNSTSYAQVLCHYHALEGSINWSNAVNNSKCKICKRKSRPTAMLLCDKCHVAIHMDCMKPPLKDVPDGDWFCEDCKPQSEKDKKNSNRSKRANRNERNKNLEDDPPKKKKKVVVNDSEDSESDYEKYLPNGNHNERNSRIKSSKRVSSNTSSSSLVPLCEACRSGGELISCKVCCVSWHIECIKPAIRRVPRGKWACSQCSSKSNDSSASKRSLDTTQSDSSISSDNELSLSTPARKSRKKDQGNESQTSLMFPTQKQFESLLADIAKHRDSWPFMAPVTLEEVPDYFEIISKPMDFGSIRSKLKKGEYKDEKEVVEDMSLVFENCDTYNHGESDVFKAASRLFKFIMRKTQDLDIEFPESIKESFLD